MTRPVPDAGAWPQPTDEAERRAPFADSLASCSAAVSMCTACPRLVAWREHVARERRAAFAGEEYWGRPVPGWGDPAARVVVVGLAPAAHGANRTGRMFTGDRSGEWLYRAMHRAGLASQPESLHARDGLHLRGAWVTAAGRCAPPDNRPQPVELDACRPWLVRELELLANATVYVTLGGVAYTALWRALANVGVALPRPRPKFGHGVRVDLAHANVLCSYHPSQQNTFTGRLTEPMLDDVFATAALLAAGGD